MPGDNRFCNRFREQLAVSVEDDLCKADREALEQHLGTCFDCAEIASDLRAIAAELTQLPLLSPSHDLWPGIKSRIETSVMPNSTSRAEVRRLPYRTIGIAAVTLIAVSSGLAYVANDLRGVHTGPAIEVQTENAHQTVLVAANDSVRAPSIRIPAPHRSVSASHRKAHTDGSLAYEREILLMERLVHTHHDAFDPRTLDVIERNLRLVDRAIRESRAALAKNPHNALLESRLIDVLNGKIDLLRTAALLASTHQGESHVG